MKIKSIAAICKKNKNIAIFERYSDDGENADRRLPEVLVRSMREAGTMRSLTRRCASGRGTPVPLRRVRGRNALQAL